MSHPEKYNVYNAIKVGDCNVGRNDRTLAIPWYMAFLLEDESGDVIVPETDIDAVNNLV